MAGDLGKATTSTTFAAAARNGDTEATGRLRFSEIISALSLALDLTEGAVQGHALRTCLMGMRIATELQLDSAPLHNLYYALLLKDVGCSSNSARMCEIIGGDERVAKSAAKLVDWTKLNRPDAATLKALWKMVLPNSNPASRGLRIVQIGLDQNKNNEELIALRCDRGASIVKMLGLGDGAAEAVLHLDEHWDGSGYPQRLLGTRIPLLSRIMLVAQHLDVFSSERGPAFAMEVLHQRRCSWFDPVLVSIAASLHKRRTLWLHCGASTATEETRRAVLDIDPGEQLALDAAHIDGICRGFAAVVDAKSPFTFRHSVGVAEAALGIARQLGLAEERTQFIYRSALLHDIGKLSVSNAILDKAGKPNSSEWKVIREHPALTRKILEQVSAFKELAVVAGEHHEKLDGSGYPNGLTGRDISQDSRILAVADIYGALSENRPYREGLSLKNIIAIMGPLVPKRLDSDCFDALLGFVEQTEANKKPQSVPAVRAKG